ncbi:MAG: hypothetical protein KF787_05540 [Phycisphaeraceae bacterium]|nr:hypothetical protein [Phycisphaerae bacterium]MBX3392094.1 hypothetical protein [Phycisphaeraceae bacterium]HRJ48891.1 hypothetical protein [Phycisphaerales bacterium]
MAASHAPHEIPIEHEPADSWHHHDLSAEGMPQREHASVANPLALFITFVALSVVTLALVGIVQMYYYQQVSGVGGLVARQDKEATLRMSADAQLYSQESERRLGAYEWVDAQAGTVSIPIEAAFDRVIETYSRAAEASGR